MKKIFMMTVIFIRSLS